MAVGATIIIFELVQQTVTWSTLPRENELGISL